MYCSSIDPCGHFVNWDLALIRDPAIIWTGHCLPGAAFTPGYYTFKYSMYVRMCIWNVIVYGTVTHVRMHVCMHIHTFKASRLLLISAPSILVCLSDVEVSAPLSLPAKSISENFPCSRLVVLGKAKYPPHACTVSVLGAGTCCYNESQGTSTLSTSVRNSRYNKGNICALLL